MSAFSVISSSPAPNDRDVVLGVAVRIVFSADVNQDTVNDSSFALTGPGDSTQIAADEGMRSTFQARQGREYITGTFTWEDGRTLIFKPGRPLRPEVTYQVLITGGDSILAANTVRSVLGDRLSSSYKYSFTTGSLNVSQPPAASPIPALSPKIPVDEIQVIPRLSVGNNLLEEIEIWFPEEIDVTSLDPSLSGGEEDNNPFNDILLSLETLLNDPLLPLPQNPSYTIQVDGRVIKIQVSLGVTP